MELLIPFICSSSRNHNALTDKNIIKLSEIPFFNFMQSAKAKVETQKQIFFPENEKNLKKCYHFLQFKFSVYYTTTKI